MTFAATAPYALIIVGCVLLYYGAEWLVGSSAKLAVRFGVTPFIVGVTIVGFGTSAPEFVVSVQATLAGSGDIAVGNVLGSNIFNTAVVLGLSALICPILINRQFFRFDIPALIIASLITWYFLTDGVVQIWEGIVLITVFVGYMTYSVINSKKDGGGDRVNDGDDDDDRAEGKNVSIPKNALLVIMGLALLVGGAHLLVIGAVDLARSWGVSEAIIGLTIIAFGTSLPEVAASAVAAFKKHSDIAIGNVVGSNMFNILLILGTVGAMGPTEAYGIATRDLLFMVGINFMLFIPLFAKSILNRPVGAAFIGVYAAYIFLIVRTAGA
ncbi:MAG: calcium/sodium antiporter [Betaproteobacteria bacterium]|nr:calcium/sodium antiporter [Betaproteobacteria bacterium]